tara:strand:- start:644 stop:892 length:249 start_codon:yes stop_codon:yes gene_type:complete
MKQTIKTIAALLIIGTALTACTKVEKKNFTNPGRLYCVTVPTYIFKQAIDSTPAFTLQDLNKPEIYLRDTSGSSIQIPLRRK